MNKTTSTGGKAELAFDKAEAGIEDDGFSQALDVRLSRRNRVRRFVLISASLTGLCVFAIQLEAGRHLLAGFLDFSSELVVFSPFLVGRDWLGPLAFSIVVAAVLLSTMVAVVQALGDARQGHEPR
jgi:hypothetical protein